MSRGPVTPKLAGEVSGRDALLRPYGAGADLHLAGLAAHPGATWNQNAGQLLWACREPPTEAEGGAILGPRACQPQALVRGEVSPPL